MGILERPLHGRGNGADLFERLREVASEKELRVFLLGGRLGAADSAAEILQRRHSGRHLLSTMWI